MSSKVIDVLNKARERELHAILQYMVEHYELDNVGYDKLGSRVKEIAIVEMNHAEELGERILFLDGSPVTKPSADVKKNLSIADLVKYNIELEAGAIEMYNEAAAVCVAEGDNVSKTLFEKLLDAEDDHLDEFQKILDHIQKLGDVYISTLIG
ncbi:MAG: ferritin-like domain-containing protein [Armatimonadota bacterium]|nr:ferritin-like domain-containing protein [Armatimonadota bacterium]